MLCYECTSCSLLFWLNDSDINKDDNLRVIVDLGANEIACPNCCDASNVIRNSKNDIKNA